MKEISHPRGFQIDRQIEFWLYRYATRICLICSKLKAEEMLIFALNHTAYSRKSRPQDLVRHWPYNKDTIHIPTQKLFPVISAHQTMLIFYFPNSKWLWVVCFPSNRHHRGRVFLWLLWIVSFGMVRWLAAADFEPGGNTMKILVNEQKTKLHTVWVRNWKNEKHEAKKRRSCYGSSSQFVFRMSWHCFELGH